MKKKSLALTLSLALILIALYSRSNPYYIPRTTYEKKFIQSLPQLPQDILYECVEHSRRAKNFEDCEIRETFNHPLAMKMLQKLLAETTQELRRHNILFWAEGGTLLGAYRFQSFLPWDDDIDLMVYDEQFAEKFPSLKRNLENLGYIITDSCLPQGPNGHVELCQVSFSKEAYFHKAQTLFFPSLSEEQKKAEIEKLWERVEKTQFPHLDLFTTIKNNQDELTYESITWRQQMEKNGRHAFAWKSIFPLKEVPFNGIMLPILKDTPAYVHTWYSDTGTENDYVVYGGHTFGRYRFQKIDKLIYKNAQQSRPINNVIRNYLQQVFPQNEKSI